MILPLLSIGILIIRPNLLALSTKRPVSVSLSLSLSFIARNKGRRRATPPSKLALCTLPHELPYEYTCIMYAKESAHGAAHARDSAWSGKPPARKDCTRGLLQLHFPTPDSTYGFPFSASVMNNNGALDQRGMNDTFNFIERCLLSLEKERERVLAHLLSVLLYLVR